MWTSVNNYISEVLGVEGKVDKKELEKKYADLKELESLREKVDML